MTKKLSDIELSDKMVETLDKLERIELDFEIDEPQASAKKITGRFVGYLRDRGEKEHWAFHVA